MGARVGFIAQAFTGLSLKFCTSAKMSELRYKTESAADSGGKVETTSIGRDLGLKKQFLR